jgi:hypothetical protein
MKKIFYSLLLVFASNLCLAQNFVPNGSFEINTGCPTDQAEVSLATPWINPTTNIPTVSGTSDYYSLCSTNPDYSPPVVSGTEYQPARTGNSYMALYLMYPPISDYREYIEVPLTSSLVAGSQYDFKMYVNIAYGLMYTTDDIGVYFSNSAITGVNNYTPQITNPNGNIFDSLNWTLVSGTYTAVGGESHIIIGNFYDDVNTDTIYVFPSNPSPYLYVFIDDVSLFPQGTGMEANEIATITAYPNPVNERLYVSVESNELSEITIYDMTSKKVFEKNFNGSISINTQEFSKGVYFYEIKNKNGTLGVKKLVKE